MVEQKPERYVNPYTDFGFKKLFGTELNKDLLISLLNALFDRSAQQSPDEPRQVVKDLKYLPTEKLEAFGMRRAVFDVYCEGENGEKFIVEMQMDWNNEFQQRVILNASKAVVSQLKSGEDYHMVKPVYSLSLINDIGFDAAPDEFYHDYAVVDVAHTDRRIEGLRFIFIELPKFKPHSVLEKKMAVLWLRFLTEIDGETMEAPTELLENPDTCEALALLERRAYNDAQMYAYERYWDAISSDKTRYNSGYRTGVADSTLAIASNMKADGMPTAVIAKYTGLSVSEIDKL